MKRIVADSTTLILLAKCGLLEVVSILYEIIVPSMVIKEAAAEELSRNYSDAAIIRDLVSKDRLKVKHPDSSKLRIPLKLHQGEEDALRLALESAETLLATDDGKAIKAARFLKIPFIITPKIVVDLFMRDKISFMKARQSIEKLGKIGRYSPDIIAESIVSLSEAKNGKADNNKNT